MKRIAARARLYSGALDRFGTIVAQDEYVGSLFKLSHELAEFLDVCQPLSQSSGSCNGATIN